MNTSFETVFTVMPKDCNYLNIIFGGFFFSQMDIAAAMCVSRLLQDSKTADSAVTHKFTGEFLSAAECGDIIFLSCKVTETRKKAIVVRVTAEREHRSLRGRDLIAIAEFVFVSKYGKEFRNHGLVLVEDQRKSQESP